MNRQSLALLVALTGCGTTIVTPPPDPPEPTGVAGPAPTATSSAASRPPPVRLTVPPLVETSSDAWVTKSIRLQARHPRALLVTAAAGPAPSTIDVPRLSLDVRPTSAKTPTDPVPVGATYRTLQEAADASRGGDVVAVAPGTYAGFVVGPRPDAGDDRYVRFVALGKPGAVRIDRAGPRDKNWMILLEAAHHVVIEGFAVGGTSMPGKPDNASPRAGIMIDGGFPRTGKLAHHIVVVRNFSHHHRTWGLHSVDSRTVLIQDNLFALSGKEHSAYVSDGSDDYVIRRNVFFGSHAGGLQVNLDPEASLEKLLDHPRLAGMRPAQDTRTWALELLARATEEFGEHGFPDGRGVGFIIEDNVMNGNGRAGGGALNLAALQGSLIQNNLLYGNFAHGIAQWDNENRYDAPYRSAAGRSAADLADPQHQPLFGCRENVVRNNTVLMRAAGRAALQSFHGSSGTRSRNNLLVNDAGPSIEIDASSVLRHDAGHNVVGQVRYAEVPQALRALGVSLPEGPTSVTGVTGARVATELVRPGEAPWVLLEDGWWRLNPARPDLRPRAGSALLTGRGERAAMPPRDLDGKPRAAPSIGALAP